MSVCERNASAHSAHFYYVLFCIRESFTDCTAQSTLIMAELSLFKQHVIRTTARFMCIFRAAI